MRNLFSTLMANRARLGMVLLVLLTAALVVSEYEAQVEKIAAYFPIENIKIVGKFENQLQADIEHSVKSVLQGGYFTVDIIAIRQALMVLPWVEEVTIRRQWPAGLNIAVTEKQAIAYWGSDRLLSSKGEVFSPAVINRELAMPYLAGPDNLHKSVWLFLKETNQKIAGLGVVVKRLILDERRSWEMQLSNDVAIKLGREDTENRMRRFVKVFNLANAPEMQKIELIDLRYPNGFAMRMKQNNSTLTDSTLVKEG